MNLEHFGKAAPSARHYALHVGYIESSDWFVFGVKNCHAFIVSIKELEWIYKVFSNVCYAVASENYSFRRNDSYVYRHLYVFIPDIIALLSSFVRIYLFLLTYLP